jgi:hypothetical protein
LLLQGPTEDLDLAVVAAFSDARQERELGSSSSMAQRGTSNSSSISDRQESGVQRPTLLLGELLAALPQDLLYSGGSQPHEAQLQPPSAAAALLSYLQQHSKVYKIKPADTSRPGVPSARYEDAVAFEAAGACATWQVQLLKAGALQLLLQHNRWAGILPAVEAELLAMMRPRSENFPLVPRVPLLAAVTQLGEVLPQLLPYLQMPGWNFLGAAVIDAPLSEMFGLSCGVAYRTPTATAAAAEGVPNSSSTSSRYGSRRSVTITHIELRPCARLPAWADGVRTCPNWQGCCPQGVLCNQSHLQPAQWLSSSQQQQR